jgi:hypothetical protein
MSNNGKFWHLPELAFHSGEEVPTPPMETIMSTYKDENYEACWDLQIIKIQLKLCKETHKTAIENAKQMRRDHLTECATIAHLNGDLSLESAIKQLINIEASIHVSLEIKRVMGSSSFGKGISLIKIPKPDGTFETIVDPTEIEEKLLERNKAHYRQANVTAMATKEMKLLLGPSGTSTFCNDVLNGEANTNQMSPAICSILSQLSNSTAAKIDDTITFDNFTDALHTRKEKNFNFPLRTPPGPLPMPPQENWRRHGRNRRQTTSPPPQYAHHRPVPRETLRTMEKGVRSDDRKRPGKPSNQPIVDHLPLRGRLQLVP